MNEDNPTTEDTPTTVESNTEDETLLDAYERQYRNALQVLDNEIGPLVASGKIMQGILLWHEKTSEIDAVHAALQSLYTVIYENSNLIATYNPGKLKQLGDDLLQTWEMRLPPVESDCEWAARKYLSELTQYGFTTDRGKHNSLERCMHTEIEYMLCLLRVLIEPDFIPLEYESDDIAEESKPDRYIPRKVKISIWQRDQGKCVECGSQEKLEYDHIIPVSKGGSNTERNVQLLCEKCNRQKSAHIQ
jgi:hypothetical protein